MTTTTLSEAQLALKARFDAIDTAYQAQLQTSNNPDQLAIARIKNYSRAYVSFLAATRAQLEAAR